MERTSDDLPELSTALATNLQQQFINAGLAAEFVPEIQTIKNVLSGIRTDDITQSNPEAAEAMEAWLTLKKRLSDSTIDVEMQQVSALNLLASLIVPLAADNPALSAQLASVSPRLADTLVASPRSTLYKLFDNFFRDADIPAGLTVVGMLDCLSNKHRLFPNCQTFRSFARSPDGTTLGDVLPGSPHASARFATDRLMSPPGGLQLRYVSRSITEAILDDENQVKPPLHILHGSSGVGKTVAALLLAASRKNTRGLYFVSPMIFNEGYVRSCGLVGSGNDDDGHTSNAERDEWVRTRVVGAVCREVRASRYRFAPLGEKTTLFIIIDEMGTYREELRGLCAVSSLIRSDLVSKLDGTAGKLNVKIIAVGTGCDGCSVPGSHPDSYKVHCVDADVTQSQRKCWDGIAAALVEQEPSLANLAAAAPNFPPAVLRMLENPRIAAFFADVLQKHAVAAPSSHSDGSLSKSAIVQLTTAAILHALLLYRRYNALGRTGVDSAKVVFDAAWIAVNACSHLKSDVRDYLVARFGVLVDEAAAVSDTKMQEQITDECNRKLAAGDVVFRSKCSVDSSVAAVVRVQGGRLALKGDDGVVRSWLAAMPRFRCPASIAAIAMTDFGRNFDAAGSAVDGSNFEQDVFSAVALYARMPPLDPSKGDIVEATTHLRRIVDGLGVRRHVIRGKAPFRIPCVEEQPDDDSESEKLPAHVVNTYFSQLQDDVEAGDAYVLLNESESAQDQGADVIVLSPAKLILIQCKSCATAADPAKKLANVAKNTSLGFYDHGVSPAVLELTSVCTGTPKVGAAGEATTPAATAASSSSSTSSTSSSPVDAAQQSTAQHNNKPFAVEFVLVWTARDDFVPASNSPFCPSTYPVTVPATRPPNGIPFECKYHVVDATLRKKHREALEPAPLFPVAQSFVERLPEIGTETIDAVVCSTADHDRLAESRYV